MKPQAVGIPSNDEILALLDRLESGAAEGIESQWLEFKPWHGPKDSMHDAYEYAVCFANADGGVIVFGVADGIRGRATAIHGASRYDINTWLTSIYDSTRPHISVQVEELQVPEGTGRLLLVRVPAGGGRQAYGTVDGMYKKRVARSCMPMDPAEYMRGAASTGALDWSGMPADGVARNDLDPIEIERARGVLSRFAPDSELLKLSSDEFLSGLGAIRQGQVTNAGLLAFGRERVVADRCPQHVVHYVHQSSDTEVDRNDLYRSGLLNVLERIEQAFTGPGNPEQEVTIGLFKLRIPAYPLESVREAVLNAVTHRDYTDPGEVLIRHTRRELVVTSPGGFVAGISPSNILRCEPASRNKQLAGIFQRLRLVESAGVGRRRIFVALLAYGKRMPGYETDGHRVTLRIHDESFDERTAALVAKWRKQGRELELDGLMVLAFLRENMFLDSASAATLLQLPRDQARSLLDTLTSPDTGILERKGKTKASTYHLNRAVAKDLLGKAAYVRTRGINPIRYAEMVRAFVADYGSITPRECRELLGLGDSASARVEVSRYLAKWADPAGGFLRREGNPPKVRYFARDAARSDGVSSGVTGGR